MSFSFLLLTLLLSPAREPIDDQKPPQPDSPVQLIAGLCDYGVISQSGRSFTIRGIYQNTNRWTAEGWISPTGKIYTIWTNKESGMKGVGIYEFCDGNLNGSWAWVLPGGIGRVFPSRVTRYAVMRATHD